MDLYFNNNNTGNSDWSDSANWWDAPNASGSSGYNPTIGDSLTFETNCDTNIPTDLSYNITIQNGVTFTISNYDTTTLPSDYFLTVDGTLNVNGTFAATNVTIFNVCNVAGSANFVAGTGTLTPSTTINVSVGGTLYLYNYGMNLSTINVSGTIYYYACSIDTAPTLLSGASIYIVSGSNIAANITINSNVNLTITSSTISTGYTVTNNNSAIISGFSGLGSFINNNACTIESFGLLNTTFTNNGTCTVSSGGIFSPTIFTNNGTINVNGNFSMNSSYVYTNNGTFNFGSLYSTKFKGRIFPQVPSSASWGNALL